ncbi:MAG: helix-turn-helix domain-containing protein [Flavobacteriaceae bacterium]|nr:MAG: helix-turn-helix domain-containing protein [Flavobacteriaceae bacterium]
MHFFFDEIKQLIKEQKLFLDPDFSLKDLVEKLNSTTKKISQTINYFSGSNFYTLINYYRVAHFKKLLLENKKIEMNIDELIKDCGFKSKSTFYSHFKKDEGCTLSEYMENITR